MFTKKTNLFLLLACMTMGSAWSAEEGSNSKSSDNATSNTSELAGKYYDITTDKFGHMLQRYCNAYTNAPDNRNKAYDSTSSPDEAIIFFVVEIQNDPEMLQLATDLNETCKIENCSPSIKALLMQTPPLRYVLVDYDRHGQSRPRCVLPAPVKVCQPLPATPPARALVNPATKDRSL
jgi:hypothetical protein